MEKNSVARTDVITKNPLKLVAPPKAPFVLTRVHIDILKTLRDLGHMRASTFDEDAVDDLFKARPRLVELVRGYVNAQIDITTEGLRVLANLNGKAKGESI